MSAASRRVIDLVALAHGRGQRAIVDGIEVSCVRVAVAVHYMDASAKTLKKSVAVAQNHSALVDMIGFYRDADEFFVVADLPGPARALLAEWDAGWISDSGACAGW